MEGLTSEISDREENKLCMLKRKKQDEIEQQHSRLLGNYSYPGKLLILTS